ncbi:MAG: hypothetical protein R3C32_14545 [Chloroflexota bacterium]
MWHAAASGDALVEGRDAVVTGIVKRAHPSATDQRFGIAPRDARDIRLGAAPVRRAARPARATGRRRCPRPGHQPARRHATSRPGTHRHDPPVGRGALGTTCPGGRRARAIDAPWLTLDDGSARGLVRLLDFDPMLQPPLRLGEVVNVTGTVATRDVGGWEIVARAEGLLRASGLSPSGPSPVPSATAPGSPAPSPRLGTGLAPSPRVGTGLAATSGEPSGGPDAGLGRLVSAGLVGLGMAGLATLVAGLLLGSFRRRQAARERPDGTDGGPSTHQPA